MVSRHVGIVLKWLYDGPYVVVQIVMWLLSCVVRPVGDSCCIMHYDYHLKVGGGL